MMLGVKHLDRILAENQSMNTVEEIFEYYE
jgi:hypothetical protein